MAKKRALVLTTTFPRWFKDSTPQFVYQLSNRLGEQYDMTILAPHYPGAKKQENMGTTDVHRFAYFKPESQQKLCYDGGIIPNLKKSLLAKIQLPLLIKLEYYHAYRLIKQKKINLIHAHWVLPSGWLAAFLKKKFNIPLIITIHGSDLFPLKNPLFKKLQQFAFNRADIITVNSQATQLEVLSRFPALKSKVHLIPMGVDTSHFKPRVIKKPSQYSNSKIILFVGRLSDQKGVQYLIQALPDILQKEPTTKLLIIGEGPFKQQLENIAFELNVSSAIHFHGALSSEELAYYYNIADLFVLPALSTSTGTEALGLSLLEAMSSGCPVIGTNIGGIPNIIDHKKTGLLVDQQDVLGLTQAALEILLHRAKAKQLGKHASAFVKKNYSWSNVVKKFSQAYKDLL